MIEDSCGWMFFCMIVLSLLIVWDEKGDDVWLTNKKEYEYIKKEFVGGWVSVIKDTNEFSYELGVLVYNAFFFKLDSNQVNQDFFDLTGYDIVDNVSALLKVIDKSSLSLEHLRSGFFAEHLNKIDLVGFKVSGEEIWNDACKYFEL